MKKTLTLTLFITCGIVSSSFSMESKNIIVAYDTEVASVQKLSSQNLSVTPLSDKTVMNIAYGDEGILSIRRSTDNISSPSLEFFAQQPVQRLIFQNPDGIKIRTDLTMFPEIISNRTYHYFHNNGYLHAANKQAYTNCIFGFENNAAVKLNPQSIMGQQVQNSGNLGLNLLGSLFLNHVSPNDINNVHQSNVQLGSVISGITIYPFEGSKRDVLINGNLSYGDVFKMDLSTVGATFEFQPNANYIFEILS